MIWHLTKIQVIGPVYDPQSVFFQTEKKNVFYAKWIGFTNKKSVWTGKTKWFSVALALSTGKLPRRLAQEQCG